MAPKGNEPKLSRFPSSALGPTFWVGRVPLLKWNTEKNDRKVVSFVSFGVQYFFVLVRCVCVFLFVFRVGEAKNQKKKAN